MRRLSAFLLALALVGPPASAQQTKVYVENKSGTATLGALNAAVTLDFDGRLGVGVQIDTANLNAIVTPEISCDKGVTWFASSFLTVADVSAATLTFSGGADSQVRQIKTLGCTTHVRVRVSTYTSGTSVARITATATQAASSGAASAVTPGTTTVTGCQNLVLYGDNSSLLNCEAALGYTASTDTLATTAGTGSGLWEFSGQTNISGPDATTNVEIGSTANNANAGTGGTSVVIGNSATNTLNAAGLILIGSAAGTSSTPTDSVGLGRSASIQGANSVALGATVTVGASSIVFGMGATSAGTNQFVAGSSAHPTNSVFFGKGVTNATATAYTIGGTGGSGTDNAGGGLTLASGRGTGTAIGGPLVLQRSPAIATGTTAQTLVDSERVCSKAVTLTNSTATTVMVVSGLTAHQGSSGTLRFGVHTSDATNDAQSGGIVSWSVSDTTAGAGGETCNVGLLGTNSSTSSSGTLTVTADCTTGTGLANIRLTSTQTVMTPTSNLAYVTVTQESAQGTLACQ